MVPPGPPGSHEWIESWIYIGSHPNRPIYPPEDRFGFKPRFEQEEYAMLMCLGWSTSQGQAPMSTLNYPCGWEPSQPRHNDAIIRGALYHWANSPSCEPPTGGPLCQKREKPHPSLSFFRLHVPTRETWGRNKGDPINLFRPRIISSWAWSYFTVEKRKKTSISKFNSDVAPFFLFWVWSSGKPKYPTSISSPWKGGDPAAPSSTATLLRLHSSH